MGLSSSSYLWTALMPLAVICYYFFRKKFEDRQTSSILYWQQLMQETEVSPYLKKLQRNLLFYLQLTALTLLTIALAGPFLKTETLAGSDFVFIVDRSASMLAGSPSIFEQQKAEMIELVDRAGGKPITLISAGEMPSILVQDERDANHLKNVIAEMDVIYEQNQLDRALALAETLADSETTAIHVFTDQADRSEFMTGHSSHLIIHANEKDLTNVSIRQFGLAKSAEGDMRAVIQLHSDSRTALSGRVGVMDGNTEQWQDITIRGGEELQLNFEDLPLSDLWWAHLEISDDYQEDNRAATYVGLGEKKTVIDASLHELVSKGLRAAGIEVSRVPDEQLKSVSAGFIATDQESLLKDGDPILLFGREDTEAKAATGQIRTAEHILFSYASLEGVYVSKIHPPFPEFQTIAWVGEDPFIQLSPEGDIAVLARVEDTDWPLHPSFPLFLWGAAEQLEETEGFLGVFHPNEQRVLPVAGQTLEIYKDNEYKATHPEEELIFTAPAEPGIYEAVGEETSELIVVLPEQEKQIAAGRSFEIGDSQVTADTVEHSVVPWLIVLIFILLLIEWEVYRRGTSYR